MKIKFFVLALFLCFQVNAFSMFDCDCDWTLDLVCIQTDDGNIIPFPNECWANCLGYDSNDFVDCDFDTSYDPACGCNFDVEPVCVAATSGEIVLYPNTCVAECNGYTTDDFLDCNYDLPTNPNCGCDYELDEVCVEVEDGIFLPFPNPCWATCAGYTESDYVNCDQLFDNEIEIQETVEYLYNIIIDSVEITGGEIPDNNLQQELGALNSDKELICDVQIYPNPVSENDLNLKLNLSKEASLRIDLLDMTGKLYKSISHYAHSGNETLKVEINDLPVGVYYLNIYSGKSMESAKFVKGR